MSYKIGDVIGKYTITRDFDSANGGQCQWGFATCNGEEFFIKKFLSPVYKGEKAAGSEKSKQKNNEKCDVFAKKQLAIKNALSACGNGGLVVRTIDFFRHGEVGGHYFKVSQKVDTSSLSSCVHTLEAKKRLFVMLTAAGAINILHTNGIIHLDLKPDNILIQEWEGKLIAKIIDFDSSILEGESIASEDLVGDPVYYSPEFGQHIATKGKTPAPTKKSDTFALGLVFCRYWTGKMPNFSSDHQYAYEAVLNGEKLTLPSDGCSETTKTEIRKSRIIYGGSAQLKPKETISYTLNPIEDGINQLLEKMLVLEPEKRLSIDEVHKKLRYLYHHIISPKSEIEDTSEKERLKIIFNFHKS